MNTDPSRPSFRLHRVQPGPARPAPVLLGAGLVLALAAGGAAQTPGPAGAEPAKGAAPAPADAKGKAAAAVAHLFGVVDMAAAAPHTKAYAAGLQERGAMTKDFQDRLSAMSTQIKSLQLEIDVMLEGEDKMKKQLDRETLIGRHSLAGKMFKAELERQEVVNNDKIYQELSLAVAELARTRGLLVVFRKRPHQTVAEMLKNKFARSENEALAHQVRSNQQRNVIYHAPTLDLTEDLIKYLKK